MKLSLIMVLLFSLLSCEQGEVLNPDIVAIEPYPTGLALNGFSETCFSLTGRNSMPDDEMCPALFGPGNQFQTDCRTIGKSPIQCGCQDFICVGGQFEGVDVDGVVRTCAASTETICTDEITPSDVFADDCRAAGKIAVACGCHDWICVDVD